MANCLRILAPSAPYSGAQLYDFMVGVSRELVCLSDPKGIYFADAFFLLESLASVKSVVLLFEVEAPGHDATSKPAPG